MAAERGGEAQQRGRRRKQQQAQQLRAHQALRLRWQLACAIGACAQGLGLRYQALVCSCTRPRPCAWPGSSPARAVMRAGFVI